ncbi:hypothetical protein J5N97_007029 [Dioscorea zingiberensis]|uniref:Uncharacterized protein n=1 Tax=Dioscorea zingiberensis TaxID=325984 RepID=A0A9D5DCQ3_9LILI|nr:hypothetical protein J5N97_007029 [Dioscorea zingiberensis]
MNQPLKSLATSIVIGIEAEKLTNCVLSSTLPCKIEFILSIWLSVARKECDAFDDNCYQMSSPKDNTLSNMETEYNACDSVLVLGCKFGFSVILS